MSDACRRFRERLGSLALGHLEAEEAAAVRAHVDGCSACRAELRELRAVGEMLALADVDRIDERPSPPPDLGERIVDRVRRERAAIAAERRRRSLRRWAAGAAAAIVLVAGAVLIQRGGPEPERIAFPDEPPGIVAVATLTERPWGLEIELEVEGLPGGETYRVWLKRVDEEREPAGSFRGAEGPLRVVLASGISRAEVVGVGVSEASGETLMYAHLEEPAPEPEPSGPDERGAEAEGRGAG